MNGSKFCTATAACSWVFGQNAPVANKTYAQCCPISRALDVIGQRWTLLIIRDLGFGPRRFSQLQGQLHGISPSLLSVRLRQLINDGVIVREGLRYRLTTRGVDLLDVVAEIGRWGMPLLPESDVHLEATAATASRIEIQSTIACMIHIEALPESAFIVQFDLDDMTHTVEIVAGGIRRASQRVIIHDGPIETPAHVVVRGTLVGLTRVHQGVVALDDVMDLDLEGSAHDVARWIQLFGPLPQEISPGRKDREGVGVPFRYERRYVSDGPH